MLETASPLTFCIKVTRQAGDFYKEWITNNVVGPFKGDPVTLGW